MLKLNIQLFGGRGATSGGGSSIDGVQVVKSTNGYKFWNIGGNAPKGYIGLIKPNPNGGRGETAYFKTQYADEIANFRSEEVTAMNYENIKTLNSMITRSEKALDKVKKDKWFPTPELRKRAYRLEQRLEKLNRVKEIRQKLGL